MNNKSISRCVKVVAAVFLAFALGGTVGAQIGGSGSIQGAVSDSTGAVVPGATVTAMNVATGVAATRTTTPAGYYVISPLPAGEYTVSVSATGFQKVTQQHIVVDALAQVGLNLTLTVGQTSEQITVSAAPPPLDTADASMSQTVRNDAYVEHSFLNSLTAGIAYVGNNGHFLGGGTGHLVRPDEPALPGAGRPASAESTCYNAGNSARHHPRPVTPLPKFHRDNFANAAAVSAVQQHHGFMG
jgi:hypothetical protein